MNFNNNYALESMWMNHLWVEENCAQKLETFVSLILILNSMFQSKNGHCIGIETIQFANVQFYRFFYWPSLAFAWPQSSVSNWNDFSHRSICIYLCVTRFYGNQENWSISSNSHLSNFILSKDINSSLKNTYSQNWYL